VAIPEGLPLTVGVSLAFSVKKMFNDGILVRKLDAPERLAGCEEILCGKTATITTNEMTVAYFYLEANQFKNARKDTFFHCELTQETIELVKDSILYNCSATVEMGETTFAPAGNGTEVGLLSFLQDADIPIHILIQRKQGRVRASIPFSTRLKYSAVAVEHPDRPGQIAIYIKGAPEILMGMCPQALGEAGIINIEDPIREDPNGATTSYREDFEQKIHRLAGQPLRVLACAYTELHQSEWQAQADQYPSASHCLNDLVTAGRLQFIMIGAFALRDKVRADVRSAVRFARDDAQMTVRMLSGDHIETATAVAR
jgi:magnesium-transporting ATPase (P-type)